MARLVTTKHVIEFIAAMGDDTTDSDKANALHDALCEQARNLLANTYKACEKALDLQTAAIVKEGAEAFGGLQPAAKVSTKTWAVKVEYKFGDKASDDLRALILGHANQTGGLLQSSADDRTFVYGFDTKDAAFVIERCGSVGGLTVSKVK